MNAAMPLGTLFNTAHSWSARIKACQCRSTSMSLLSLYSSSTPMQTSRLVCTSRLCLFKSLWHVMDVHICSYVNPLTMKLYETPGSVVKQGHGTKDCTIPANRAIPVRMWASPSSKDIRLWNATCSALRDAKGTKGILTIRTEFGYDTAEMQPSGFAEAFNVYRYDLGTCTSYTSSWELGTCSASLWSHWGRHCSMTCSSVFVWFSVHHSSLKLSGGLLEKCSRLLEIFTLLLTGNAPSAELRLSWTLIFLPRLYISTGKALDVLYRYNRHEPMWAKSSIECACPNNVQRRSCLSKIDRVMQLDLLPLSCSRKLRASFEASYCQGTFIPHVHATFQWFECTVNPTTAVMFFLSLDVGCRSLSPMGLFVHSSSSA